MFHYDGIAWTRVTTSIDAFGLVTDGAQMLSVGFGGGEWLDRAILPTETNCAAPWDNDNKDGVNCDDPDCAANQYCMRGGACESFVRLECGAAGYESDTYSGIARIDDLPCLAESTPGPETSYRFVAETSGPVTVTVNEVIPSETPNASPILDLAVVPGQLGACQLDQCIAPNVSSGPTQSITFDAEAGRTYYLVIDGPVYRAATFTIDVTCS